MRNVGERTQRCSSITAIIISSLQSFGANGLPPDARTRARRAATAAEGGNKSVRGSDIRLD